MRRSFYNRTSTINRNADDALVSEIAICDHLFSSYLFTFSPFCAYPYYDYDRIYQGDRRRLIALSSFFRGSGDPPYAYVLFISFSFCLDFPYPYRCAICPCVIFPFRDLRV